MTDKSYPATYVQILTACNMHCAHCCYSCSSRGEYMNMETFKAALQWHRGNKFNIGGGEPTIHPLLFDFIDMVRNKGFRIWMATNGKRKTIALKLAQMTAEDKNFTCLLSLDSWHQPISREVRKAFVRQDKVISVDLGKGPIKGGRWRGNKRLVCPMSNKPFIKPDGKVYQCGCRNSPCVGNVFDGFYPLNGLWVCYKGKPLAKVNAVVKKAIDYNKEDLIEDLACDKKELIGEVKIEKINKKNILVEV